MLRPSWRFSAGFMLAFALLAAALPARAEDSRLVRLSYYGYLGNIQVGQIDLTIEMAPGARPARDYTIAANLTLSGAYAKLLPFRWQGEARGGTGKEGVRPASYQSRMDLLGNHEAMALAYRPDGQVEVQSTPPTVESRIARERGLGRGTVDPLSAAVLVVDTVLRTGRCEATVPVFDGARRYDLSFASVGQDVIERTFFSTYEGPAMRCSATAHLLAGFQPNATSSGFYPSRTDLWLARAVSDAPPIPVRVVAESRMGLMRVELVQATTVAAATP
ncbi:MAG: DUF3108 domain-containing protein [Pseudomonadota bacterium]